MANFFVRSRSSLASLTITKLPIYSITQSSFTQLPNYSNYQIHLIKRELAVESQLPPVQTDTVSLPGVLRIRFAICPRWKLWEWLRHSLMGRSCVLKCLVPGTCCCRYPSFNQRRRGS